VCSSDLARQAEASPEKQAAFKDAFARNVGKP